jgi:hypothetical protein
VLETKRRRDERVVNHDPTLPNLHVGTSTASVEVKCSWRVRIAAVVAS